MPTSEVIKRLKAYGLEVKAAATAVDEKLADAALTGKPKPKAIASNGAAKKPAAPVLQQRAGFGHGTARAPRAENLAPKAAPKPQGQAQAQAGGRRPTAPARRDQRRPTRSSLQGERAPGSAGGVRRVVIDSQAAPARSRAVPGGPAAVPAAVPEPPAAATRRPAPARHLRRARRAGRLLAQARRHPAQLRVDGQGRVGVPRCRRAGDHQEADEPRRDGDAHADAVRRRDPGHRRRVRQGDRDRHGGRGRQRGPDVRGR